MLVDRGRFVDYLTSRDTADELGQTLSRLGLPPPGGTAPVSNGAARADGWSRIPIIRMTNINLEPGAWALADMIADTEDGLYMETNKSWSIDDRRLNFQFGTEWCREIKGRPARSDLSERDLHRNHAAFWGGCDAVGSEWGVWGTPNCGKGEPMQVAHVGHGAAPARFRDVRVGVLK